MNPATQSYDILLLSLKNISKNKTKTKYFQTFVPKDIRLDIAMELKNAELCLWTIENDIELEFIDNHIKRENENYHELNEILSQASKNLQ